MSKAHTRVIDLPENTEPTGSENLYITTETTDEKISLDGVKIFFSKNFVEKNNNLNDVNFVEARNNLNIFSKEEINDKFSIRDEKLTNIENKNIEQDGRLETLENTDINQNERLTTAETKNEEQDTRLGFIEDNNKEQHGRLVLVENKNTEQDGRLETLENTIKLKWDREEIKKNFAMRVHNHTIGEITDFVEKSFEFLKNKIIAGQNVTLTEEEGKIKITSAGGGAGGGGGDMLKSIYDRDNDGVVDVAKTANSIDWANINNVPSFNYADIVGKPTNFNPTQHNHTIGEITGLEENLNGKQKIFLNAVSNNAIADFNKTATASRSPEEWDIVIVKYTNGTNCSNMTLNINGSWAKNVRIQNYNANGMIHRVNAGWFILYYYDGAYYHMVGSQFNSLYSNISIAEAKAGTLTTSRYITAQVLGEMAKRENHSGTQAINTIAGLQNALDGKVNAEAGKRLSSNDFTNEEKLKLRRLKEIKFAEGIFPENNVFEDFVYMSDENVTVVFDKRRTERKYHIAEYTLGKLMRIYTKDAGSIKVDLFNKNLINAADKNNFEPIIEEAVDEMVNWWIMNPDKMSIVQNCKNVVRKITEDNNFYNKFDEPNFLHYFLQGFGADALNGATDRFWEEMYIRMQGNRLDTTLVDVLWSLEGFGDYLEKREDFWTKIVYDYRLISTKKYLIKMAKDKSIRNKILQNNTRLQQTKDDIARWLRQYFSSIKSSFYSDDNNSLKNNSAGGDKIILFQFGAYYSGNTVTQRAKYSDGSVAVEKQTNIYQPTSVSVVDGVGFDGMIFEDVVGDGFNVIEVYNFANISI